MPRRKTINLADLKQLKSILARMIDGLTEEDVSRLREVDGGVASGMTQTEQALTEVEKERGHQDTQWGGPEHDDTHAPRDWIAILGKHFGRLERNWDEPKAIAHFRRQLIKVAAVAVAAVEWCDRRLMERAGKNDEK